MKKRTRVWAFFALLFLVWGCLWMAPVMANEVSVDNIAESTYFQIQGQWNYTIVHKVVVTNNGSSTAKNIMLEVPLMDEQCPVYMDLIGEQFDPYPQCINCSANGLRYATYSIESLAPNESRVLYQRYAVTTSSLVYDIDASAVSYDYDRIANLSQYLQPESDIQSDDPQIADFLASTIGEETNPYKIAGLVFAAVNLLIDYDDETVDQDAISVLNRRTAYCEGYANLFAALLRAAGIPARLQNGYLFSPDEHLSELSVDEKNGWLNIDSLRHTWVEFYLPDSGWLVTDPTFTYAFTINGISNKFVDWGYFANIPDSRRYLFFREGSGSEDVVTYSATGGDIEVAFSGHLLFGKQYYPFNDIAGHWADQSIIYAYEAGYFSGTSKALFSPELPMTRAMFVTVLGRMYENGGGIIHETGRGLSFIDVDDSDYFAKYVNWAVAAGIADGYSANYFGSDDSVSREQMAKLITDYLEYLLQDNSLGSGTGADLSKYADAAYISAWATDGVTFCTATGLLNGMPDGTFVPQGQATRAQVAAILQRIDEYLGK